MTETKQQPTISIINKSDNELPGYSTEGSSGMDLRANLSHLPEKVVILKSAQRLIIPTGIYLQIPKNYEGQIRPRSGLAAKKGVTVLNTPGTIDSDYTGEIKVILVNLSDTDVKIHNGDRIAQLVISPYVQVKLNVVEELTQTSRGEGGFGHTGIK